MRANRKNLVILVSLLCLAGAVFTYFSVFEDVEDSTQVEDIDVVFEDIEHDSGSIHISMYNEGDDLVNFTDRLRIDVSSEGVDRIGINDVGALNGFDYIDENCIDDVESNDFNVNNRVFQSESLLECELENIVASNDFENITFHLVFQDENEEIDTITLES